MVHSPTKQCLFIFLFLIYCVAYHRHSKPQRWQHHAVSMLVFSKDEEPPPHP